MFIYIYIYYLLYIIYIIYYIYIIDYIYVCKYSYAWSIYTYITGPKSTWLYQAHPGAQPSRQRFNSWAEFADSCGQFPLRCRSDPLETVIHW